MALIPLLYKEYNYGGVLQFYALQQAIKKMGVEADVIKASAEKNICYKWSFTSFFKKALLKPLMVYFHLKRKVFFSQNLSSRISKTNAFKKEFCLPEKKYNASKNIYDAYICGSDQIWNPGWARERAFLSFAPSSSKKIIYAASIGCESLSEFQKKCFKPYVEKIDCISVREHSAKKILDSFIEGKNIDVVLDPTLLLTVDEWNRLTVNVNLSNYIFIYFLGDFEKHKESLVNFAKITKKKIVNIYCASFEKIDKEPFGDILIKDADPRMFISLVKNASIIFTDSFHASVFSVLFKKNFYVLKRHGCCMHGRIETLFENFKLSSRIIDCISPEIYSSFDESVYDQNEYCQKQMMNVSYDFLKKSLGLNCEIST